MYFDPRHSRHTKIRIAPVKADILIAAGAGVGAQGTVGPEYPAVVRTPEIAVLCVAAPGLANLRAAMPAAIKQHVNALAIRIPDHDHGGPAQARRNVISGGFDLAFVADIHPGATPDALHFQVEDRLLRVHFTAHAGGLNQRPDGRIIAVVLRSMGASHKRLVKAAITLIARNILGGTSLDITFGE